MPASAHRGPEAPAPPGAADRVAAFFGPSPAMALALEQVLRAAQSRTHVLVSGEPGTGRETVAREIHRRAGSTGAFVKFSCTVRPPHDFEAALFGPAGSRGMRPSRTAAEQIAPDGTLYRAMNGTLFLENLPHMPGRTQARLARLLRAGESQVEDSTLALDIRAVAAVDAQYDQAVVEGRVRADLHALLSRIRITLPPLRDRREDIAPLSAHLIEACCRRVRVPEKTLSEAATLLLTALPWHGNSAELRAVLEDVLSRVRGDVIQLRDVLNAVEIEGHARPSLTRGTLRQARAAFEHEYIAAVLRQHHGRVPDAARTLGIQRTNLYRKLKRIRTISRQGTE